MATGAETELIFSVTRKGQEVGDLAPYLGSLGQPAVLREGDLACLRVHPTGGVGSRIAFHAASPSVGRPGSPSSLLMKGEYIRRPSPWRIRLERQPSRSGEQLVGF